MELQGFDGQTYGATLAYSSWHAMRDAGETDAAVCQGNDFSLIEVPREAWPQLHPAVLHFGGPTGPPAGAATMESGDLVHAALSSDAYGGYVLEAPTRPAHGTFEDYRNGGWTLQTDFGVAGSSQGDSGGGLLGPDGEALGITSTGLQTGTLNFANLWLALGYMLAHEGWAPSLVAWPDFDAEGEETPP